MQNDLNAGNEDEAPIPKAMQLVNEVMAIAEPA